jgi:hypothetical protein
MKENNGFRVCASGGGRATDCGILDELEAGRTVESTSSVIFGKLGRWFSVNISLCRLAFGVAEICTPWKSGFLTGFLDSMDCQHQDLQLLL